MKFVFILPNLAGGGAEKAILKTANSLLDRNHSVDLVLLEETADYDVSRQMACHILSKRASRGYLGKRLLAHRLRKCVGALAPDLVVSTLPFADEVAILAKLPRHYCRIANTLSAEIARLELSNPAKATRRLARYRALYGRRSLIAVSHGVATDLGVNMAIASPVTVIANPFDFDAIRDAAKAPCSGLPTERYVIHVGRFSGQKRHDVLLDAWQEITGNTQLVLLTQPDEQLTQMIGERGLQGRVIVAGFQKNPYPWIAGAALLVLCSDHEGLPNVLIEALICGTPVISTDCPSGPREILAAELPEALLPCGDVSMLAQRTEAFLSAPPDISRVNLERFGVQHTAAAYERLALSVRESA